MTRVASTIAAAAAGLVLTAGLGAFAQGMSPADAAIARKANMRDLSGPEKIINDQLKKAAPDLAEIRRAAPELANYGREMPKWFPKGSGAESGAQRIRARPEIWSKPKDFAAQLETFAKAAAAAERIAASDDMDALRQQMTAVRAGCTSCHDRFRAAG